MNDTTQTHGRPDDEPRAQHGERDDATPDEEGFSHGGTGDVPQPRGGGISNRPLDEEQRSQDAVPDRGHRRDE